MKNLYLIVLLLAFPFLLFAQNIHGLWTGALVNDSTHRIQNFELGLSEYKGKITGYTYTTFIDNDTFYYSIKRIKAERKDSGVLVIEDVEMVGNNFPERAAKHVKQITIFPLLNDSTIDISKGRWNTTQTKKYYSIGGSAKIKEQEDEKESDLLAHLQEANVKTDIAVNRKVEKKEEIIAKNTPPVLPKQKNNEKVPENKREDVAKNFKTESLEIKTVAEISKIQNPNETKSLISEDKKTNDVSNNNPEAKKVNQPKNSDIKQPIANSNQTQQNVLIVSNNNTETKEAVHSQNINQKPAISINQTQQNTSAVSNKNSETKNKSVSQAQAPEQKKEIVKSVKETDQPVTTKPEQKQINNAISINTPATQKKDIIETVKELPAIAASRKTQTIQDIYFKNDSLILSLYDNGIVDGDTVSVFLNGETIISKQMLKEAAIKKIIYISEKSDSLELVLFADNLGSIPPNTGLLTVRDGDDVYQVRFSADLQKNASIILRRRKD